MMANESHHFDASKNCNDSAIIEIKTSYGYVVDSFNSTMCDCRYCDPENGLCVWPCVKYWSGNIKDWPIAAHKLGIHLTESNMEAFEELLYSTIFIQ